MKVYVAASFAYNDRTKTEHRKSDIERVVNIVKQKLSAEYYLPHQLKIPNAWDMSLEDWSNKVFEHDISSLCSADLVIFISYGKENNSGSVWECGFAYAKGIPVVVVKMTNDVESLMITSTARAILREEELNQYDFDTLPEFKTTLEQIS